MHSFENPAFRAALQDLLAWRRDVRHFRSDPLSDDLVDQILQTTGLAPSVGLSQPWRFVRLRSENARNLVLEDFESCNVDALAGYEGERAALYSNLKLSGLREAPAQFAVFSDHSTVKGGGLGRRTMPEVLDYSVVVAVHTMWLCARALGVGMGWVSVIDPIRVSAALDAPKDWRLIAILCLGWPEIDSLTPELERLGWERRMKSPPEVLDR